MPIQNGSQGEKGPSKNSCPLFDEFSEKVGLLIQPGEDRGPLSESDRGEKGIACPIVLGEGLPSPGMNGGPSPGRKIKKNWGPEGGEKYISYRS